MAIKTLEEFLGQVSILDLVNTSKTHPEWKEDIEKYLDSYNKGELQQIRDVMTSIYLPEFPLSDSIKNDIWKTIGKECTYTYNNLLAYYSVINSPLFNSFNLETKGKLRLAVNALILQIKRQIALYGNTNDVFGAEILEREAIADEQSVAINQYMRYGVEQQGLLLLPAETINGQIIYPEVKSYAHFATKQQLQDENYEGAWKDIILVENPFTK